MKLIKLMTDTGKPFLVKSSSIVSISICPDKITVYYVTSAAAVYEILSYQGPKLEAFATYLVENWSAPSGAAPVVAFGDSLATPYDKTSHTLVNVDYIDRVEIKTTDEGYARKYSGSLTFCMPIASCQTLGVNIALNDGSTYQDAEDFIEQTAQASEAALTALAAA